MLTNKERASHHWPEDSIRLIAAPSSNDRSTFFYVQEAGYFKVQQHYNTERENLNSYLNYITTMMKDIDNVSHFNNLFKDRVGKTPLAFRKVCQYAK